jgi:hypothetical protein
MNRLLTPELVAAFAKQGETHEKEAKDIVVLAHFTMGLANWYAAEYYSGTGGEICFGYANLGDDDFAELGDFSLSELEKLQDVKRNDNWKPCSLQKVIDAKGHIKPVSTWSPTKPLKR